METARPLFSVVCPTCNRAYCVCNAIESVLRQSFADFELVIADDGSTDGTADLLRARYADEMASGRIKLVEIEHGGVCAARNAALAAATGTWITYLDSDNIVFPEFLQVFIDGIVAHPDARNFYAALVRRHAGTILDEPFSRAVLLKWNYIDIGVYCHHRDLIEEFGVFDGTVPAVEDWDLLIRHTSKYEPVRLGQIVMDYSDSRDGDRLSVTPVQKKSHDTVRRRYAKPRQVSEQDRKTVLDSHFFDGQWYSLMYGDMLDGQSAVDHYLLVGWLLGCNPGPLFSGDDYLKRNRDVAAEDINPLVHYERYGRDEGRLGFLRNKPFSGKTKA